jgi:hypothetical protein
VLLALSVRLIPAVRVPVPLGLKVTLIVQLAPAATLAPAQVLTVSGKSLALFPPSGVPEIVSVAVPLLVTITVCGALVVPTV